MSIPQPYDTGLTEEQLAEAFRRALGDMTDEEIENAIATAINLIPKGLVYRGAYNYFSELPTNAKEGEVYTVKYKGTSGTEPDGNEYAWGEYEGTLQWIPLGVDSYTKKEIDEMYDEISYNVESNKSDILSAENDIAINRATLGTQKKNIIDQSLLLNASGWTVDENEVYSGMLDTMYAKFSNEYPTDISFKEKTSYTFSCQFKANAVEGNLQALLVNVEYTDGTTSTIITTKESSDFIKYTGVTDKNKTIKKIKMSYMKNRKGYIKEMQLEEGTIATVYEPYKPSVNERLTANENDILSLDKNKMGYDYGYAYAQNASSTGWFKLASFKCEDTSANIAIATFYITGINCEQNGLLTVSVMANTGVGNGISSLGCSWAYVGTNYNGIVTIKPNDFKVVANVNGGYIDVELWCAVTTGFSGFKARLMNFEGRAVFRETNNVTLYKSNTGEIKSTELNNPDNASLSRERASIYGLSVLLNDFETRLKALETTQTTTVSE